MAQNFLRSTSTTDHILAKEKKFVHKSKLCLLLSCFRLQVATSRMKWHLLLALASCYYVVAEMSDISHIQDNPKRRGVSISILSIQTRVSHGAVDATFSFDLGTDFEDS